MLTCLRTDAENADFIDLVAKLDADLKARDGDDHTFYAKFNKIDQVKFVILAYEDDNPVGCGAIKKFDENTMEVKRMYVNVSYRGKGIATMVLGELELWAKEMNFDKCVLETGKRQPEAVALYLKNGYNVVRNFGQYENVENSLCFEKNIR
ncbi:MAG TPA: GNAT family N-acetyltransferase [Puia sp.]|nr:GNAT family N-acetyltransferase [Puia sp.]